MLRCCNRICRCLPIGIVGRLVCDNIERDVLYPRITAWKTRLFALFHPRRHETKQALQQYSTAKWATSCQWVEGVDTAVRTLKKKLVTRAANCKPTPPKRNAGTAAVDAQEEKQRLRSWAVFEQSGRHNHHVASDVKNLNKTERKQKCASKWKENQMGQDLTV